MSFTLLPCLRHQYIQIRQSAFNCPRRNSDPRLWCCSCGSITFVDEYSRFVLCRIVVTNSKWPPLIFGALGCKKYVAATYFSVLLLHEICSRYLLFVLFAQKLCSRYLLFRAFLSSKTTYHLHSCQFSVCQKQVASLYSSYLLSQTGCIHCIPLWLIVVKCR